MALLEAIDTRPFSEAKAGLSEVMSQVVREHRPAVIARGGKEEMLAMDLDDFRELLDRFQFEPGVSFSNDGVVVALESLGLLGSGANLEDATTDLLEELRAYATDYLNRYEFFKQTDRREHGPWIWRFALTPLGAQRALLEQEPTENASVAR